MHLCTQSKIATPPWINCVAFFFVCPYLGFAFCKQNAVFFVLLNRDLQKTIAEHFALQNVRKMLKQCQNVFWQRTCYLYSFVFCKSLRSTCKNSFLLVNILLAKMYFCITFWYILQSKMFQAKNTWEVQKTQHFVYKMQN